MAKVLITDYVHPRLIQGLEDLGYDVDYNKDISRQDAKAALHAYVGIVINSKVVMDRIMIDAAPQLEWIARLGSGLEIIDLVYAADRGVAVYNSPEGNRNAVAEHAIGMMLALQCQLLAGDKDVRAMSWDRESRRGTELMGKTIGIIGLGNTGTALASKLATWGMTVLSYDLYQAIPPASLPHVTAVDLDTLLLRSDIVSLHIPHTPITNLLVNELFLSKCKEGVIIVNTSRGKVVDIATLISSIERGDVGGACLDVFPNERSQSFTPDEMLVYQRLYALPQVVLSPHVAGWTHESLLRIAEVLLSKIAVLPTKVS